MRSSKLAVVVWLAVAASAVIARGQAPGSNIGPGGMGVANPMTPDAAQQATGTGLIVGQVVDTEGRPVSEPIVVLTGTAPTGPVAQRSLGDPSGRFVFRNLPRGRYEFSVSARGFLQGVGFGQRRANGEGYAMELADGEKVQNLTIRMWRPSSIEGTVTDEHGDPIVRAEVWVVRRSPVTTSERFVPAESRFTDDRGVYRAWRLGPGEYVVMVRSTYTTAPTNVATEGVESLVTGGGRGVPNPTIMSQVATPSYRIGDLAATPAVSLIGPPPGSEGKLAVYPTTFYPSVRTAGQARVVVLRAGDHRTGVDIQARLLPAFRVEGSIAGPSGAPPATDIRLVSGEITGSNIELQFPTAITRTTATGRFTFLGVPAGQYQLQAFIAPPLSPPAPGTNVRPISNLPTLWARMPVTVSDADVSGLTVSLTEGPRVRGRVEFEGTPPNPQQMSRFTFALNNDILQSFPLQVTDGSLLSPGLVPGRYLVRSAAALPGWSLKSAMLDGVDVSDRTFPLERDVADLVITMTQKPNQLSGVVRSASGGADANAMVLLVPADRERWAQRNGRSMRTARVSRQGAYSFANLPPGDYLLAAVDDEGSAAWPAPTWIASATRLATRVTVMADEQKTMDLRTSEVR